MSYDVMIVGVGGQGTILTSNILGEACVIEGRPVRGAETHGMAQRGGSVESQIRIDQVHGPLIAPGTADLLLSFDLIEAVRTRHWLKRGGAVISALECIVPTSVYMHDIPAPDTQSLMIALEDLDLLVMDTRKLAIEAGNMLTQNVVILGAASLKLPIRESSLKEAITRIVPQKTVEINLKAFDLGRREAQKETV